MTKIECKSNLVQKMFSNITAQNTGWAVIRAPRNYVECDVKQSKINGLEYLFLSFDVQ